MNFEFLKGLKGLDAVYAPCADAEELVKSKPYLSLTAARKSAELLAKLIYIASHASALEGLTFADILADTQVRNYIHDRDVMDAFHFIRKSGNKAVHGEEEVSASIALAVLQNLHFIAGETARHFSLIRSYPDFNVNIPTYPNATLHEYGDLDAEAIKMFLQYMEEAKSDVEEHIEPHFPVDEDQYNGAHWEIISFHEQLVFDHRPYLKSTALYIKEYLDFWIAMTRISSIPNDQMKDLKVTEVTANIRLELDDAVFTSNDMDKLESALITKLPYARHILMDNRISGSVLRYMNYGYEKGEVEHTALEWLDAFDKHDPSLWGDYGFLGKAMQLRKRELFTFKSIIENADQRDFEYHLIRGGMDCSNLAHFASENFLSEQKGLSWCNDALSLGVVFDFEKHRDVLERLHDAVRGYLSEDEISYLEDVWDDDSESVGSIFCGTVLYSNDLNELQTFLDRVNGILAPILSVCTANTKDAWLYSIEAFGIAKVLWIENEGFRLFGGMM